MPYSVYILECADGTLYVGSTNDVAKRLVVHNEGKGARYTRGRIPVILRYEISIGSRGEALKTEARMKKLSRMEKLRLCAGHTAAA